MGTASQEASCSGSPVKIVTLGSNDASSPHFRSTIDSPPGDDPSYLTFFATRPLTLFMTLGNQLPWRASRAQFGTMSPTPFRSLALLRLRPSFLAQFPWGGLRIILKEPQSLGSAAIRPIRLLSDMAPSIWITISLERPLRALSRPVMV